MIFSRYKYIVYLVVIWILCFSVRGNAQVPNRQGGSSSPSELWMADYSCDVLTYYNYNADGLLSSIRSEIQGQGYCQWCYNPTTEFESVSDLGFIGRDATYNWYFDYNLRDPVNNQCTQHNGLQRQVPKYYCFGGRSFDLSQQKCVCPSGQTWDGSQCNVVQQTVQVCIPPSNANLCPESTFYPWAGYRSDGAIIDNRISADQGYFLTQNESECGLRSCTDCNVRCPSYCSPGYVLQNGACVLPTNSCSCGSAARSYSWSDGTFGGDLCGNGCNATSTSFPLPGQSSTWSCTRSNYDTASCTASRASCPGGYVYNGSTCVEDACPSGQVRVNGVCIQQGALYTCGSNGNWSANSASCQPVNYNNSFNAYNAGGQACVSTSQTPDNMSCRDPETPVSCGSSPVTCAQGSVVGGSDNGNTTQGQTRTWQCTNGSTQTLSCSYTNPITDPAPQCGSAPATCSVGAVISDNSQTAPGTTRNWSCVSGPQVSSCSYVNRSGVECGSSPVNCNQGSYVGGSDNGNTTAGQTRTWQCTNGSNTLSCSYGNPVGPVSCGASPTNCTQGSYVGGSDNGNTTPGQARTWQCTNGVQNLACSYTNPSVGVSCGTDPDTQYCAQGLYVGGTDNNLRSCDSTRTWQCTNGSTTISCNKTNPTCTRYSCNGVSCQIDAMGPYTSTSCDGACTVPPGRCGDGVVNSSLGEQCDNGDAGNTNSCSAGGNTCNTSCQIVPRCCNVASNNFYCSDIKTRVWTQTWANCAQETLTSSCGFGQCCGGAGSCSTAPGRGGNKTSYSCNGNILSYQQDDGNCGRETITEDCSSRGFGWTCDPGRTPPSCVPVPRVDAQARLCKYSCASGLCDVSNASVWNDLNVGQVGLYTNAGALWSLGQENPKKFLPWGNVTYAWLTNGSVYHTRVLGLPSEWSFMLTGFWPDHYTEGSTTWSYSTVTSGYRIAMGDGAIQVRHNYCWAGSGSPKFPKKLHVTVWTDINKNGALDGGAWEEYPRAGMWIGLYDTNNVLLQSGYAMTGNQCDYNANNDPGISATIQGCQGAVIFDVIGGTNYRVRYVPLSGFYAADAAPYWQAGTEIDPSLPGGSVSYTVLNATGIQITTLTGTDTYLRGRSISVPDDLALTTTVVNSQAGYNTGDIINVRYTITNKGYRNPNNTRIVTSIINGLDPVMGSMSFSGACGNTANWSFEVKDPNQCNQNFNGTLNNNCNCNTPGATLGCDRHFLNRMFITWNGNWNPTADAYPSMTYPASISDVEIANGNYQDGLPLYRPRGKIIEFNSFGNGVMAGGTTCNITVSYRVTTGVVGNTYAHRACVTPEGVDDMYQVSLANNNCDNFQYRVGVPGCVVPGSLSGALIAGTNTRVSSGSVVPSGSGIIAWFDDVVTPSDAPYCQSEYRQCTNGTFGGTYAYPSCVRQCSITWAGGQTVGLNPGSSVTAQNTLVATSANSCQCSTATLQCVASVITGGTAADPNGRPYLGGTIVGPLADYRYPSTPTCVQSPECSPVCVSNNVDLYEVHYTMSGNTVLSNNRVIDQVHPNICIIPSSFTGRLASNEVRITFYSGTNTGVILSGLNAISGSVLSARTDTGQVCGPYVEYEFTKPLYPGAEGYFFYEYKLLESITENPNANSGENCVWIYRYDDTAYGGSGWFGSYFSGTSAPLDPGDAATRFSSSQFSSVLFAKFNPTGQLFGNNRICIAPPISICPVRVTVQDLGLDTSICGNGIQEIGEYCDEGHAPYKIGGYNNDSGLYLYNLFSGLLGRPTELTYNYCTTQCKLGKSLACEWAPTCSQGLLDSIQEGEEYPFWWNFGSPSNSGFTTQCVSEVNDGGKMIYNPGAGYQPTCTFELTNGINPTPLLTFTSNCFGTGSTNYPIFKPEGDRFIRGDIPSTLIEQTNSLKAVGSGGISLKEGTLKYFSQYLSSSQGTYSIPITPSVTSGVLGEYQISLRKIEYSVCKATKQYVQQPDGTQVLSGVILSIEPAIKQQLICQNNFVVTRPYLIQEGSLLTSLSGSSTDFNDFYTAAKRLADQTAEGAYSSQIKVSNAQVPTYIPTLTTTRQSGSKQDFVTQFIDKYTLLSVGQPSVAYTHNFDGLNGSQSRTYQLSKITTRNIYIYTGTVPLALSDAAMDDAITNNPFRTIDNLTIIAPNADVLIFGDLRERDVMILTKKDINFAGASLKEDPQIVEGILVSSGYAGVQLKNSDKNQRWIDDGRLVINGLLISNDVEGLVTKRRSIIKDWYESPSSGSLTYIQDLIQMKKNKLVQGASVRIVPNPKLFTSPPPGATELFESLSIGK